MRSSGHESFVCRYPWLPKAYAHLREDPRFFSDETQAMVKLGLGKNMVRSLRFWVQAFGLAASTDRSGRELNPTPLADQLLNRAIGWDPYLEDTQTLWLLHWNLATQENPLLAWEELLFRWSGQEIVRSSAITQFEARAAEHNMRATKRTLGQHFDIFVTTYFSTAVEDSSTILEDSLDCPLVELGLLVPAGKKTRARGGPEQIYRFRHEPKPEISAGLFLHCVTDFWQSKHCEEQTLSLQQISSGRHSPGTVFRLPELHIRERLESIESDSLGHYKYFESANQQQLQRSNGAAANFLASAYTGSVAHA